MNEHDFKAHTRYTVTLRGAQGRLRPANLYVYRLYREFMIARMTEGEGLLYRIDYADVERIVKEVPVAAEDRYLMPEAVLKESMWTQRKVMDRYSTAPHVGK